jgi:hypothetical protein
MVEKFEKKFLGTWWVKGKSARKPPPQDISHP